MQSSSATVALPFLESFGFKKHASAAEAETEAIPPKRMAFLGFGWGVTKETWYPKKTDIGEGYSLSEGLMPLERHKGDFTLIQNLSNQYSSEAHWGSTFWLTGANRYSKPGQSFHNSISVDQVAAEQFGTQTRFTSLQFASGPTGDGHGPGSSLAWSREGKPIAGLKSPLEAYRKLFAQENTPIEVQQRMLKEQRSVLDTVLEDAKSMSKGLNATDKDKVEEYFQSIRDIETRISKEEDWLHIPKAPPGEALTAPAPTDVGYDEIKVTYDLMVAAMQVDATRVLTYRQPVDSLIKSFGATISGHNMSHYDQGERKTVSQTRDQKQSELLAYLIDRLKATKEAEGSSLFDNVCLTYRSNISSVHHLTNCPTVVTGGAAGIKHGRHLVMKEKDTPLCNLWLSLLHGMGIEAESHGDSRGTISELFS